MLPVNDPVNELDTCVGIIFPRVIVIDGVVVEFATVPDTPFEVATDTFVTDPVAEVADVGAQEALTEYDEVPNRLPVICDPLIIDALI